MEKVTSGPTRELVIVVEQTAEEEITKSTIWGLSGVIFSTCMQARKCLQSNIMERFPNPFYQLFKLRHLYEVHVHQSTKYGE